jgi:YqaJ-like recombinase protein
MDPTTRSRDRRRFIGGSDARIIMGSDEQALIRLWREKRGEVEPEDLSGNLVVQLGVATEDLNRRWYEANTGQLITDIQKRVRHPALRWMAATLDGRVEGSDAVFEAKFMLPWSFSEEAAAEKYMPQLQHNMWVVAARAAVLSVITGGGIVASAHLRDAMLGELNAIGSEDAATIWAQRRLAEKNKLNATDAKHVEEAFRDKLLSFAIHHANGVPESNKNNAQTSGTTDGRRKKGKPATPSPSVDKSTLMHAEPRRIRDRDHIRHVMKQPCLICGRQPSDAHHLRFAQSRALGRKVSDEFTVPLCRTHHREVHHYGDEETWWQNNGIGPLAAARTLWLETHPVLKVKAADSSNEEQTR